MTFCHVGVSLRTSLSVSANMLVVVRVESELDPEEVTFLTLTHCLSVPPTLWVSSSPGAVHLLCLGFGDLVWLQTLAVVTDAVVSSPALMLFHIFIWKILGVINGPGLARPREESGTKLTWPSIGWWEAVGRCVTAAAIPPPPQPHLVFVGRKRGKAGTLWSKGCSGTGRSRVG